MRKQLIASTLGLFAIAPIAHAGLQDDLNARWRGEVYSNCNGIATNNRVFSDLISGEGQMRFAPGEMARVTKIDAKRRRVDVFLDLDEPVLIEYSDGPFRLYREASCEVELLLDFGDEKTSDLGVNGVEAQFAQWFERYTNQADAEQSSNWNERERDEYPIDYEQTLADYRVWKIEQHNLNIEQRIAESDAQTVRLLGQISRDDEFGGGLSHGIAAMVENIESTSCDRLVASSPGTYDESHDAPSESWADGYRTGQMLAYYIELGRMLSGCFIDPDDPEAFGQLLSNR